jgi:peroxiredoxin
MLKVMLLASGVLFYAYNGIAQFKKVPAYVYGKIDTLDFPSDFRNGLGVKLGEELRPFKLVDIEGDSISSSDFNHKLLVLNFWFVGCTGCKQEEPNLLRLTEELKNENIGFISICNSSNARAKMYTNRKGDFGYNVISIKSRDELERIFKLVNPFPTHMIIKNGIVKEYFNFALTTDDEINWFKERILEEL